METQEIMKYLPHRYPFLLVDRILEYEANQRIVGVKNVTINEPYFTGHFPGTPIMPGVLIIEAMAQVGGVLVFRRLDDPRSKLVLFVAIENARFRKPVRPGDQLRIEMVVKKEKGHFGKLNGKAFVGDVLVAEADMMFSVVDRDESESPSSPQ
ncbi:MAG: 3-hydroxyacyl-ACP dehydratase FabZ [Acidobacteria bacterium]|nr:3-hydroxyacyl-ACP dehydratase FabZ [Acidobacteriota bacterium]